MEEVVFETWSIESEARIFPCKDYAQKCTGSVVAVERGERDLLLFNSLIILPPELNFGFRKKDEFNANFAVFLLLSFWLFPSR